jgi:hypothetical protein
MDSRHSISAARGLVALTDFARCYSGSWVGLGMTTMKTRILLAVLCGLATGTTWAETLVVNDQVTLRDSTVDRPKRGSTMSEVEKRFGAPVEKHPTVGQPPITRWDYAGFSVFFEHDRVIHAVATSG